MMLAKMARLENLYISGRIGLRDYTRAISKLALDSRKKLETGDPFQRYRSQDTNTSKEGVTQDDVSFVKSLSLEQLNKALYKNEILKR